VTRGLLVLVALAACAEEPRGDTLARVKARGELVWAGDIQGGEPYVYEDEDGKLIGFEVDLAEELARRLGVKARFQQYAWSNLVPGLERGDFDIGLNGLEATSERQDRVRMSQPYYVYTEVLAVRRGSPLRGLELRGKRVATLNQTYAMDLLRAAGADVRYYEGVEEPYLDLAAGKLDAVLMDNLIAERYGCPTDGVECVPGELARGGYVILVRKQDAALHEAIDAALAAMRADGTHRAILDRWKLWDERQEAPPPAAAKVDKRRGMSWAQVKLFLDGALMTLRLSVLAFLVAVPLGFALACARLYGRAPLRLAATAYVEIFRGTPVLLQLYVLYFAIGGLDAVGAAVLGLGLNYAAYEAEVYRGAISAVPRGQAEAAHALGLSGAQTLFHVVTPQALRTALPPMTNDFIALLKDSSIVGVISVVELTKRMSITAVDLRSWVVPGLLCAALYFAMSWPLARLAHWLEGHLARDRHPRAV
jgi:polar amino acid transport system substrate-binding protein